MKIQNEFMVDAPVEEAWALLTDIPAIAPCMPGAKLTGSEGETHEGTVTVRVGPMTAKYAGTVEFAARDDDAHRAELQASGRDSRGAGTAQATIVAQLTEVEGRTRVAIDTDLVISGKVAQFGRGVMVDVSEKMLGQFAECIGTKLGEDPADATAAGVDGDVTGKAPRPDAAATDAATDEPEPMDLMAMAGAAVGRRVAIGAGVVVVVVVLVWLLSRL